MREKESYLELQPSTIGPGVLNGARLPILIAHFANSLPLKAGTNGQSKESVSC